MHPQLINMKQNNTYSPFKMGALMSSKFCPCKQPRSKMVHASNGKAQHALIMCPVFSFWGWGGGSYFLFFFLFPKLLPKVFPIAPQFYPIWFAQSSTLKQVYKLKRPGATENVFQIEKCIFSSFFFILTPSTFKPQIFFFVSYSN